MNFRKAGRIAWIVSLVGFSIFFFLSFVQKRMVRETPAGTYQRFVAALEKREPAKAFALLSTPTQQLMRNSSASMKELSGGLVTDDPAALFLQSSVQPRPGNVVNVSVSEGKAQLTVSTPAGPREVLLVSEAGQWRIDLVKQLGMVSDS